MRLLILFSLLIFVSTSVSAKKPKDKKNKQQHESAVSVNYERNNLSISASLFSNRETEILSSYRIDKQQRQKKHKKQKKLPKGLQKKMARGGALPPGWQKKMHRGEVISRETYRYARPLPEDILTRLPRAPVGTITVDIDGEIVRLAEATLTIVDILGHR